MPKVPQRLASNAEAAPGYFHRRWVFDLVVAIAFAATLWIIYGRSFDSPFIFDDRISVEENPSIVRLWPLIGDIEHFGPLNPPKEAPTSGRPLVNLSLAVNYYFGGLNPIGYHVFNLIVHLFSALLLMGIVRRVLLLDFFGGKFDGVADGLAFAAALLWAVHPMQTEAVVYITQRTELLVGFFYLTTLYGSLRYWDAKTSAGRTAWLIATTLACAAGMACKEVMVTAPIVVLLMDRTLVAGTFRRALRNSWRLYLALACGWGVLLLLNCGMPRSSTAGFNLEVPAYCWWYTQAKVLWMYFKLAIWPWPLAIHYEVPYVMTLSAAWPWLLSVAVLILATTVLVWQHRAVGFVSAAALLILSPTFIVPIVTEVAAERRMYLPLAAIVSCLVVAGYLLVQYAAAKVAGHTLTAAANHRTAASSIALGVSVAAIFGLVSAHRLAAYHDPVSLWQDLVEKYPDNAVAHNNLGLELDKIGQRQQALEHYEEALRLNPESVLAHNNLANLLRALGRYPEAISHYQQALQLQPNYAEIHYNYAATLESAGKHQEAIYQYERAIQLRPNYLEAHYNLGAVLRAIGANQQAIEHYQQAVRLKPDFAGAHANLGAALAASNRLPDAIEEYQEALRLQPSKLEVYANLAQAYSQIHRPEDAIATSRKALDIARASGQTEVAQKIETWLNEHQTEPAKEGSASASSEGPTRAP